MTTHTVRRADVILTLTEAVSLLGETPGWTVPHAQDAVADAEVAHRAVRAALADAGEDAAVIATLRSDHRAKTARARHLVELALTKGQLRGLRVLIVDPDEPSPPTPPATGAARAVPVAGGVVADLPTPLTTDVQPAAAAVA